ncbi:MAG: hypothetical protein E6J86_01555 [Deltaproteobacteria bacterium]|nr:MAG: hypothetical protein E6J86_01555 [Deltaproteobacteria bacterium]
MRTLIKVLVPALAVAFQATAQTRRSSDITAAPSGRYSLLGGETVGTGTNVVSGEFGWPSITFGYTHGLNRDRDVGLKFDLLFGVEGDSNASQFGIGFRVPYRVVALRSDRLSVLLHTDPGIKLFTTSPSLFGFGFPVGAVFGYAVQRDLTIAFGVDLNMALYVTPSPVRFVISPMFGPAAEFRIDPRLTVGINTRFGPVIFTNNGGYSDFGFVTQLLLAYRM